MVDHRRLRGAGLRLNRDEYLAWRRSVEDLDVRGDVRLDHLLRISAKAVVGVMTSHGTLDGGDYESRFVMVNTHDGSRFHSSELFDLDRLDAALARYEELYSRGAYLPSRVTEPVRRQIAALRTEHGIADRRERPLAPPPEPAQLALAI